MTTSRVGVEAVTEEDRAYNGSRFQDVRDAIFANPYQKVWGGSGEPPLPLYDVTLWSVLRGILPFGKSYLFRQATATLSGHGESLCNRLSIARLEVHGCPYENSRSIRSLRRFPKAR